MYSMPLRSKDEITFEYEVLVTLLRSNSADQNASLFFRSINKKFGINASKSNTFIDRTTLDIIQKISTMPININKDIDLNYFCGKDRKIISIFPNNMQEKTLGSTVPTYSLMIMRPDDTNKKFLIAYDSFTNLMSLFKTATGWFKTNVE